MSLKPMLARIGGLDVLDREGYYFEPKLDGYRAICQKKKTLKLFNRKGADITDDYPEFDFVNKIKAKTATLDGEIIIYDTKGNPSFNLMQKHSEGHIASYIVFDILEKDGKSLKEFSLEKRKDILKDTVDDAERIQTIAYTTDGKKLLKIVKKRGIEGVVAKKIDSTYKETRSYDWIKVKIKKTVDCIIIGYLSYKRKISSLALGLYRGSTLIHVGNVGTGFSEKIIDDLHKMLSSILTESKGDIQYVKLKYVAEVKYHEVTPDFKLRAPVFLRLRDDKRVKECRIDQLE